MHEEPFLTEGGGKPKPKTITGHRTSYKPIKIQTNYTQLSSLQRKVKEINLRLNATDF